MTTFTYEIIEHDGGWAYRAGETISERFPSHDAARRAAERAAAEQMAPGDPTKINYEDSKGQWHSEVATGDDRPEIRVKG